MADLPSARDRYDQWDAAYVLGSLDPAEHAEFERHVAGCAECRSRVANARSTIAMLGGPSGSVVDDVPPVPSTLLPGLLRKARRERRARRAGVGVLAGVAAACLVALVVSVWPSSDGSSPAPRVRAMVAVVHSNVTATAALRSRQWGTEIDVHCKYSHAGEPGSWSYGLRVVDRSGRSHPAGTWQIDNGQTIDFVGGTEVRRDRIARVQITLPDGTPILQLRH